MITIPDGCIVLEPRMVMDIAAVRIQPDQDGRPIVVYSRSRMVRALMAANQWDLETTQEYIDHNITGIWYGPRSPKLVR